jgi:small neutral amino acid transporter SnatA (MarC family)
VVAVGGAMLVNLALNAVLLVVGERMFARLGEGGRSALGKVASLLVATLGAAMLRKGLLGALA